MSSIEILNNPVIIGVSGKKQSGKDTFSKFLFDFLNDTMENKDFVHIVHFADSLKEIVSNLFDIDLSILTGSDAQKNSLTNVKWDLFHSTIQTEFSVKAHPTYLTARELLQAFGTNVIRYGCPTIWASTLLEKCKKYPGIYIISDMRFMDEAEMVRSYDKSLLIRISRAGQDNTSTHPSETDLDNYPYFDHRIFNDTTLDDLSNRALDIGLKVLKLLSNFKEW